MDTERIRIMHYHISLCIDMNVKILIDLDSLGTLEIVGSAAVLCSGDVTSTYTKNVLIGSGSYLISIENNKVFKVHLKNETKLR